MLHQLKVDITRDLERSVRNQHSDLGAKQTQLEARVVEVEVESKRSRSQRDEHQGSRGKYGEDLHDHEESDSGSEKPIIKRPKWQRNQRGRGRWQPSPRQQQEPRFCKYCNEAKRPQCNTHNSGDCFWHPNPRIAKANRDKMQALGKFTPSKRYQQQEDDDGESPKISKELKQLLKQVIREEKAAALTTDMLRTSKAPKPREGEEEDD